MTVVVGVDDSAASWHALRWAADEAERTGSPLLVAYASEAPQGLGDYGFAEQLAHRLTAVLAEQHPELPARLAVVDGDPAETLLRLAADAQLLVLARGEADDSPIRFGGVVDTVAARAACPVVVVDDLAPFTATSPPESHGQEQSCTATVR